MRKNTYKHFLFFISLILCHTTPFANEDAQSVAQKTSELAANNQDTLLAESKKESAQIILKYWRNFKTYLTQEKARAPEDAAVVTLRYKKEKEWELDDNSEQTGNKKYTYYDYHYHKNQDQVQHYHLPRQTKKTPINVQDGNFKQLDSIDHKFLCFKFKKEYFLSWKERNYDDLLALQDPALVIPLYHDGKLISRKYGTDLFFYLAKQQPIPLKAFKAATQALKKMHDSEIYHGDLKVENLVYDGNDVKIIDFDTRIHNKLAGQKHPSVTPECIHYLFYQSLCNRIDSGDDLSMLGCLCDDYAMLMAIIASTSANHQTMKYLSYRTLKSWCLLEKKQVIKKRMENIFSSVKEETVHSEWFEKELFPIWCNKHVKKTSTFGYAVCNAGAVKYITQLIYDPVQLLIDILTHQVKYQPVVDLLDFNAQVM